MNQCRRIRKRLSAYQDDEVGLALNVDIKTHLGKCEVCRGHYEALRQTCQELKALPEIDAGDRLTTTILDRVARSQPSPWLQVWGHFLRRLPAPAAMAALVAIGILMGSLAGRFWIDRLYPSNSTVLAYQSEPASTMASVKAFDAAPAGSFAQGYLQLITYSPEGRHAN
jgi:predicted anti-sigma-YlaC factor YlaD